MAPQKHGLLYRVEWKCSTNYSLVPCGWRWNWQRCSRPWSLHGRQRQLPHLTVPGSWVDLSPVPFAMSFPFASIQVLQCELPSEWALGPGRRSSQSNGELKRQRWHFRWGAFIGSDLRAQQLRCDGMLRKSLSQEKLLLVSSKNIFNIALLDPIKGLT